MIKVNYETCYGCEACFNVCPKHAIQMIPSSEGFLYPKIDFDQCINCGLCEKVCPDNKTNVEPILHPKSTIVYAAWSNNHKNVLQSTSGGLFFVIASKFIKDGGIVYGCAWQNDQFLIAEHKRVDTINDLACLRGSKYVQSQLKNTFQTIKIDLRNGLKVLFSGTPCQNAALRLFLKKEQTNLYTIDLVCHGTPSPKSFKFYIDYLQKKHSTKINSFCFRDKKKSGWTAYTSYLTNGKKIMQSVGINPFSYAFYAGFMNRNSCYHCSFSRGERSADITLSDFWGGEKFHKKLKIQRKNGFNMVMCNTDKGQILFNSIKNQIFSIESNIKFAEAGDIRLRKTESKPPFRYQFYSLLDEKGFDWMAKSVLRPKFYYIRKYCPEVLKNTIKNIRSLF